MNIRLSLLCAGAVLLLPRLAADQADDRKTVDDALAFRREIVSSILLDAETAQTAVARLTQTPMASGLRLAADADFALAAIDLGQRLLSVGRSKDAEVFFAAAEQALDRLVNTTKEDDAKTRAFYLGKRARIRAQFLGKLALAEADLEEAIRLQPDDARLKAARDTLLGDRKAKPSKSSGTEVETLKG